jgi:hypothetical protein
MLKTFFQHTKFSRATVQFSSTVRCELCSCLFKYIDMCLEVSTVTELRKVFSGRHPRQINYKIQRFGDQLHLQHQGIPDDVHSVGLRNVGFYIKIPVLKSN